MRDQTKAVWWDLFAAFLMLSTLAVEFSTVRLFRRAIAVKSWPTADGVVLHSELKNTVGIKPGYHANVRYRYCVADGEFESTTVRTRGDGNQHEFDIGAIVERYPVGSKVKVHYNPDDMHESYLEVGPDLGNYVMIVSPLLFSFLGAGHLWDRYGPGARERRSLLDQTTTSPS